ncbi:hypothetical protein D3C85_1123270 [compost metagenome]
MRDDVHAHEGSIDHQVNPAFCTCAEFLSLLAALGLVVFPIGNGREGHRYKFQKQAINPYFHGYLQVSVQFVELQLLAIDRGHVSFLQLGSGRVEVLTVYHPLRAGTGGLVEWQLPFVGVRHDRVRRIVIRVGKALVEVEVVLMRGAGDGIARKGHGELRSQQGKQQYGVGERGLHDCS